MSISALERRAAEARREALEAEAALAAARRVRQTEPRPGEKVYVTARFPRSSQTYEYFVIRTDVQHPDGRDYYVTGREGRITWEEFLTRIDRAEYEIHRITLL